MRTRQPSPQPAATFDPTPGQDCCRFNSSALVEADIRADIAGTGFASHRHDPHLPRLMVEVAEAIVLKPMAKIANSVPLQLSGAGLCNTSATVARRP